MLGSELRAPFSCRARSAGSSARAAVPAPPAPPCPAGAASAAPGTDGAPGSGPHLVSALRGRNPVYLNYKLKAAAGKKGKEGKKERTK